MRTPSHFLKLPTLIAVIPLGLDVYFREILHGLTPSVMNRIVYGSTLSDFLSEIESSESVEYIFAVASPTAFEVLQEFYRVRCENNGHISWVHSLLAGIDAYRPRELSHFLSAPMSNARGCYSSILAEHVIMCCLYFNKQVPRLQKNHGDRRWCNFTNVEMRGKTVGIVGYGNIGRAVAKKFQPFDLNIVAYRRNVLTDIDDLNVHQFSGLNGLHTVLQESDFIVAILPKTQKTNLLFSAKEFSMMKKTAVFINIGRGSTVNEDDLYDALLNEKIAGAALDVFQKEPLPQDSKLWNISPDRILLSSHNADISVEAFEGAATDFDRLARNFVVHGKLPDYLVDLERGY